MTISIDSYTRTIPMCVAALLAVTAGAQQPQRPRIVSITVDPEQAVAAPNGNTINQYGHMGVSDEHSTIFPPGTLPSQSEYLFFLASPLGRAPDAGLIVMKSVSLPDQNGKWTLDFVPSYGLDWPYNPPG